MRIVVKLSGESLAGNRPDGAVYDPVVLADIVAQVAHLRGEHQVALVVGGGNLFRGHQLTRSLGIERPTADYIGMLATLQNALVLRDVFEASAHETRVSSAITMTQLCESYMPRRVRRHLEKGRIVIFAAGLGAPYFTTDSSAVQRALEMKADILVMAKNGVDTVMSADPATHESAVPIHRISASDVLHKNLKVADQSAIALAKEHGLLIKVVGMDHIKDCLDKSVGTIIDPL
jgi:uridylate kinase